MHGDSNIKFIIKINFVFSLHFSVIFFGFEAWFTVKRGLRWSKCESYYIGSAHVVGSLNISPSSYRSHFLGATFLHSFLLYFGFAFR